MTGLLTGRLGAWATSALAVIAALSITYALAHHRGYVQGYAAADALRTADRLAYVGAALAATNAARAREQQLITSSQETAHAADQQLAQVRADAAGASGAAAGLRQRVAALVAGAGCRAVPANAPAAAASAPGPDALQLLAELYERTADRAVELAAIADERSVRGLACERAYDEVRSGINEHTSKLGLAPDDGMAMGMGVHDWHWILEGVQYPSNMSR